MLTPPIPTNVFLAAMKFLAAVVVFVFTIAFAAAWLLEPRKTQANLPVEARQVEAFVRTDERPRYEVSTLSNGARAGTEGSLIYLLDARGDAITGGYHSIVPQGDGYVARLGSTTYRLNSLGRVVSETNAVGDTVTYNP